MSDLIQAIECMADDLMSREQILFLHPETFEEVRRFTGGEEVEEGFIVGISKGEAAELKNTISVHPHILDDPFHASDMARTMALDLSVAAIITPTMIFELRRPADGWPLPPWAETDPFAALMASIEYSTRVGVIFDNLRDELGISEEDEDDLPQEVVVTFNRRITARLAEDMGAEYHEHQRSYVPCD